MNETAKTRRLLAIIRSAKGENSALPPRLTDMRFVRFVREGRGWDDHYAWSIYVSHDPCHDDDRVPLCRRVLRDRNTVIALHRTRGEFRILGREMPRRLALQLARGEYRPNRRST